MPPVQTERLEFRPWTAHTVIAAMAGPTLLELALGVRVHAQWPNPDFAEALPGMADDLVRLGEQGVSCLLVLRGAVPEVIGEIGCKSFPDPEGIVEIGFGVVDRHRKRGLATEAVSHFAQWLLAATSVRRVQAQVEARNPASQRVLEKAGFGRVGTSAGLLSFERRR
jgi:ribosomal-protein-alanine N-acetyltransferase